MKKNKFYATADTGKGGGKPDEKHDHFTQVSNELKSLKKKLDHALEKKWITQAQYDTFNKQNADSQTFVTNALAS